ncbi:MAG: hypothetical protein QW275_00890, partial [Candidatus Anstonellaceae archaeon]
MFLFQIHSQVKTASTLLELQEQFYMLHRQGSANDKEALSKFAVSLSNFASNLDAQSKDYQKAIAYVSAWSSWLSSKGIEVQTKLSASPSQSELSQAKNYIKCVELYKLSYESVREIANSQNKLASSTSFLRQGDLLTIGRGKKENLGYFIYALLSDPDFSFKIDSYEKFLSDLENSNLSDEKKKMLAYIKSNKYEVLASYLINPKSTFGSIYSFSSFKEFTNGIDNIINNRIIPNSSQRKYGDVDTPFAFSFRFMQKESKVSDEKKTFKLEYSSNLQDQITRLGTQVAVTKKETETLPPELALRKACADGR